MSAITYLTGDATRPVGDGDKIIVHCCNDEGKWGKGFVLALSKRFPKPEEVYRRRFEGDPKYWPEPGYVQFVQIIDSGVWGNLTVANLIGQHGIRRVGTEPPIRYEAIRLGLQKVSSLALIGAAQNALAQSVHMPRIGCGLAGGTWDRIEPIIQEELVERGVPVFVYDLPEAEDRSRYDRPIYSYGP